jgi:endoglucanase
MPNHTISKKHLGWNAALVFALAAAVAAPASAGRHGCWEHGFRTKLYTPEPNPGALKQIKLLKKKGDKKGARLIEETIETPQAVWFTKGTPKEVRKSVRSVVSDADDDRSVPVLVAYNLPFRDCAQFSAGGATTSAEYKAWIDAFAAGIGKSKAIVILEPDGLGIIPWYKQFRGLPSEAGSYEWCQPAEADEATAADDRFALIKYAVEKLGALPKVSVYLDGTHTDWLGAGDAAHRLAQAGVEGAEGFYLNVSNYQPTEKLEKYGAWVAKCIWFGTDATSWGKDHFDWCASQYYPATPSDFSTWGLTDQWYVDNVLSQAYPGDENVKHFVIDSSRNGQGPWTPTASYPDAQNWCNPPDRGLGLSPTANTSLELLDAYLWIKIPGESDGECTRGLGPAGTTVDPEWGIVDPAAGQWFPEAALQLAKNAVPPLLRR